MHTWPGTCKPFGAPLQGDSVATWQDLSPGYLRKNGVPYSANTELTEDYDRMAAFGDDWLIVTTVVDDPDVFVAGIHNQHALQTTARRLVVESDALRLSLDCKL